MFSDKLKHGGAIAGNYTNHIWNRFVIDLKLNRIGNQKNQPPHFLQILPNEAVGISNGV
ncbi:hypothetical protein ACKFKG_06455 [Phormidesmis sp. 146-35]